jgi:SOS-response transcriptional repressor LexA
MYDFFCQKNTMLEMHERLQKARSSAGLKNAAEAARAMGIQSATYVHHENGTRGFKQTAERYARFYRINLEWLLTGRGEMRGKSHAGQSVPVIGIVGLGENIDWHGDDSMLDEVIVDFPLSKDCFALECRGDSMLPRLRHGDLVIACNNTPAPERLYGEEAVVKVENGPYLLKILRRGYEPGTFNLESHNAPTRESQTLEWVAILRAILPKGQWKRI